MSTGQIIIIFIMIDLYVIEQDSQAVPFSWNNTNNKKSETHNTSITFTVTNWKWNKQYSLDPAKALLFQAFMEPVCLIRLHRNMQYYRCI